MRSAVTAPGVPTALRIHALNPLRQCKQWRHATACTGNISWEGRCVAQINSEEDNLWTPDTREGHAEIRARGAAFLRWLLVRNQLCLHVKVYV